MAMPLIEELVPRVNEVVDSHCSYVYLDFDPNDVDAPLRCIYCHDELAWVGLRAYRGVLENA